MLRSLYLLWLLLGAALTARAADAPSPPSRLPDNPALVRFGNAIVFYASFDRHVWAEITTGAPQPQRDRWDEFWKGREPFSAGAYGHSLNSGNYALTYTAGSSSKLAGAGGVSLWMRGQVLHHRGEYYWPVRLQIGKTHSLMFGRMGDPRNKEILYAFLQHGSQHATAVLGSMADWQPTDWHLVVVNWDRSGVELSLEGQAAVRTALREPLPAVEPTEFRVTVNSPTDEEILLDELLILSVPFTKTDIGWLQERHAAASR